MAISDRIREDMNCADYCDELSKESYSSAALKRRLLIATQRGATRPGGMMRRHVDKPLDDRREIHDALD